jgi:Flp pilus assembly protein TadD
MSSGPPTPNADDLKVPPPTDQRPQGWARLRPLTVRRTDDGWQVQIHWGGLLATLTLALGLGWGALAGAAYLFVRYERGFTGVRFTDMLLLPWREEAYEAARGDFFIKNAKEELAAGKPVKALFDLEVGVGKSPGNVEGRVLLAQFFTATRRADRAQRLLLDGLPLHRDDQSYLNALFSFLLQQQQDQVVMSVARSLLPPKPVVNLRNQLIALADAQACFYRGNYDQAEDRILDYQLTDFRDGRLLTIRLEWERGEHSVALGHLREMAKLLPDDPEIYSQTVTFLREDGREAEARSESQHRQLTNPDNPYPRIDLLYAHQKDGDKQAVAEGVESILRDFANNGQALVALADFAANSGDPVLARRIYEHCKNDPDKRLSWEDPALMTVEAEVVAKDYQAALEWARRLLAANPDWAKRYYTIFNGLQAIASYGLGDEAGGQNFLANFVNQPNVRAENFVAVSNRLLAVGARGPARLMLAQAVKTDRLNQAALTSLIKLDVELNNAEELAAEIPRLLGMRKPDAGALQATYDKLGSDIFLFNPERTALLDKVRMALSAAKARTATAI